jgi:hypothetical protein
MQKLSGLILDIYDDSHGEILKGLFPDPAHIPDLVKQAHYLSLDERGALPDDLFALVLMDKDVTLRKFACVDPGNTLLSMLYLMKTAHKLPVEAAGLASENLKVAAHWYWDTIDELEKSAGIGGAVLSGLGRLGGWAVKNPMKAVTTGMTVAGGLGTAKQIAGNLRNVGAAEGAAGGFGTIVP